ncbi:MAG: lytic transglycosylase domain-containing protein [Deltaproteobacteria bacterium]|nr:lytic transglycosylase domain-containing protein [Deltaproteobacteria bacterium]MBW2072390.1 lytic transglycosylase domain-containing protein [Deltaproteobacteria bacterium]
MKPEYRVLLLAGTLFVSLFSSTAAAESSVNEALHAAYITRLFALETRLVRLTAHRPLTLEEQTTLAQLKNERDSLCRRLNVCEHYLRKRLSEAHRWVGRQRLGAIISAKARLYGINADFVHAIIKCESNYDTHALSRAGAMGLMQLMPETAAELGVENPWSPGENIDGGIRYILALLKEFRDPWKALISYNCGPEILRRGLLIPAESRRFARKVLRVFVNRRLANNK